MAETKIYDTIVKKEPITKGWSEDKKYCVTTADGTKYLLRVTPISRYETRKSLFAMMERVAELGIPMCKPVEFGTCDDGVYSIQSWIDGEDLDETLYGMSEIQQYEVGLKAGKILRKIHEVPILEKDMTAESWNERYTLRIDRNINEFNKSGVKIDGVDTILDYFYNNRHLMKNRPRCYIHGDFYENNMMYSKEKRELYIIDWELRNFNNYADPLYDIYIGTPVTPHFSTGMVRGYFDGEPTEDFWYIYKFYKYIETIAETQWEYHYLDGFLESATERINNALNLYDNMQNPIPAWYLKDLWIQQIDGVAYQLEASFDFSFLNKYGKVFTAFDEQGSGNIAFGVENDGKKYFVKFAGAPKKNYIANRDSGKIDTESAIKMLKAAVPLYTELAHPTLIKFISAEEIGSGYAAVFEWENAIGIEPKDSPDYMRFMQMPVEKKIRAFEDIIEFHAHVAAKGYVALDFYDGSILYDYEKEKVIICDIDLYQKSPFQNVGNLGIVGSSRYVSPEECVEDAIMDEITNVYNMGATAFSIFAFGDRSPEAWTLSPELYDVAKKAVSDERDKRQQSINELIEEWRTAK